MAYNPYYPATYQYGNYYPQSYQPQQPMPQYTPQQNQVNNVWVANREEADQYPVVPNSAVRLWSTRDPVFWLKQADATGKPSIKTYDIVERTESVPEASYGQDNKTVEYVSKDELDRIVGVLNSVREEIETMKGDLYGVAGRKKPAKRMEVEEDDA